MSPQTHPRAVPADPGSPPRPRPRSVRRTIRDWVVWFGPGRLVATLLAGAVVVVGGVAVVRTPPPASSAIDRPGRADDRERVLAAPLPVVTLVGAAPTPVAATSVVHVAGAVHQPGVHEVDAAARVVDALAAAGGAREDAVLDVLNLAAPVVDGQRIYVPVEGETVPGTEVVDGGEAGVPVPAAPLDVNRATATELEALPGVGPAIAAAIVDDRTRNGPFPSVDELLRVRGIGPAKLGALRDLVVAR